MHCIDVRGVCSQGAARSFRLGRAKIMCEQRPTQIINITDCGGQAAVRMAVRYGVLFPGVPYHVITTTARSGLEVGGNLLDILYAAGNEQPIVIVSNNAPRVIDAAVNGSPIAFGRVGIHWVVSTVHGLGLVKQVIPDLRMRLLDTDEFVRQHLRDRRTRPNFRGLWVIPDVLHALTLGHSLEAVSRPLEQYPQVQPGVWLADEIEGKPTNLKLTLMGDHPAFMPGELVRLVIPGREPIMVRCYERLTEIPAGQLGLYSSSSGYNGKHFLELAVMDGSAAERLSLSAGSLCDIEAFGQEAGIAA